MKLAEHEVLVVGGGPAGTSAAWHLARLGVRVTLLDRARFPRDKVCAEYLSPQASRILASMGALEEIERAGAAHLTGMRVRAPNGREIEGSFAAQHGFRAFRDSGIAIRRRTLDAILLSRARSVGVTVEEEVKVTDIVRDASGRVTGVTATRNGSAETHRARLVIGADGLRSIVARRLGLVRTARFPRRVALVAHYEGVAGVSDVGEMHVERDGYVGMADVGGGVTNVALVVPARRLRSAALHKDLFLDGWLRGHAQLARRFDGARRIEPVSATGPFASSTRRAWAPSAALLGDAADFFDPFTGEGVYTALRGGELLAPFAAECVSATSHGASDDALARYDRARRDEFRGKWLVERLIGGTIAVPALINHAARSLSRRKEMADLLVGVVGDFVPAGEVLRASYFARLLLFGV